MNHTTAYTPLECLLLFQSLVAYGTDEDAFVRISKLLSNNTLVKDGDTYDPTRLTPDALRDLYLLLLRDELKEDRDGQEDGGQTASRKRKLPTPPPPTIKDAQSYKEKLPLLVERLYARYRDYMIRAIREDERKYAALQQEITEIERGEWDERILEEDRTMADKNAVLTRDRPSPKMNGTTTAGDRQRGSAPEANGAAQIPKVAAAPATIKSPLIRSPQPEIRTEGTPVNDALASKDSTTTPKLRLEQTPRNGVPVVGPPPPQRTGSAGPQGGMAQYHPGSNQPGMAYKWDPPYQAGPYQASPYQPGTNYPQFSGTQYPPQPYPTQPSPHGSFPHPHGLLPPHPHLPSSPLNPQHASPQQPNSVILPSNPSQIPPGSPGISMNAPADMTGQHYRPHPPSPMLSQGQPQPPNYGYQPPPPRPLSGNGPPPLWNQQYMQQYPPQHFQYPQGSGHRTSFAPPPNLLQPENRQYNSPYNAHNGPRPLLNLPQSSQTPIPASRSSVPSTPLSQSLPRLMTGTGTRWTPTALGATPKDHAVAESPVVEPLSPILRPAEAPKTVQKAGNPPKKQNTKPQSPAKPNLSRQKRASRRIRAGSTASSVMATSYRSQSVMSQTDELSMDNDFASRPLKQEAETPLGVEDTGDTTAEDFPGRAFASPRRSTKRKRKDSILSPFSPKPSVPPTHVLWTRNFPKMSASALESITGHRTASTFAAPVKERDAPGYKHLILRPQDLSSIRKAINAGHRAGAAAAPSDLHPSQTSVWLAISEDLVPPKGIINYAQFEKELMRMFANAIMFNADPDRGLGKKWDGAREGRGDILGYEIEEDAVVKDTRAMLGDVEGWLRNLRSAVEGRGEVPGGQNSSVGLSGTGLRMSSSVMEDDDEADELAGAGEPHIEPAVGSLAKRRRKV